MLARFAHLLKSENKIKSLHIYLFPVVHSSGIATLTVISDANNVSEKAKKQIKNIILSFKN